MVPIDTEKVEFDYSGYRFVLIATDLHVPAGSQKKVKEISPWPFSFLPHGMSQDECCMNLPFDA